MDIWISGFGIFDTLVVCGGWGCVFVGYLSEISHQKKKKKKKKNLGLVHVEGDPIHSLPLVFHQDLTPNQGTVRDTSSQVTDITSLKSHVSHIAFDMRLHIP